MKQKLQPIGRRVKVTLRTFRGTFLTRAAYKPFHRAAGTRADANRHRNDTQDIQV